MAREVPCERPLVPGWTARTVFRATTTSCSARRDSRRRTSTGRRSCTGRSIAAVLQGWGGPTLLDSYERERRPVHEYVMDEAVANHALVGNQLWQDGVEDATEAGARLRAEVGARIQVAKTREFNTLGVVLGY